MEPHLVQQLCVTLSGSRYWELEFSVVPLGLLSLALQYSVKPSGD